MGIRVAVVSSCVILLYCNKFEEILDKMFSLRRSKFKWPEIKIGETDKMELSSSNNSAAFNTKECLKDGEM